MKQLSYRLQEIFNLVNTARKEQQDNHIHKTQHIYDLCCDHGHLAYHLWHSLAAESLSIHAIDCASKVIEALRNRYEAKTDQRFIISQEFGERVRYLDNSIVIIAGVGAHTTIKIIEHIRSLKLDNIQVVLCCHQNIDLLRVFLADKGEAMSLVSEKLIKDQGKFYELICCQVNSQTNDQAHIKIKGRVSLVGDEIWQDKKLAREYYDLQLKYWRVRRDSKAKVYIERFLELKAKWEL